MSAVPIDRLSRVKKYLWRRGHAALAAEQAGSVMMLVSTDPSLGRYVRPGRRASLLRKTIDSTAHLVASGHGNRLHPVCFIGAGGWTKRYPGPTPWRWLTDASGLTINELEAEARRCGIKVGARDDRRGGGTVLTLRAPEGKTIPGFRHELSGARLRAERARARGEAFPLVSFIKKRSKREDL